MQNNAALEEKTVILELKHIYKDYIQGSMVVPVLKDINLQVEKGEYLAIMGPSGSKAQYDRFCISDVSASAKTDCTG